MSETSATGAGGSVAPGWYTDPQNPSQLRWWSGEGWTEHVSGGAPAQDAGQAAQQAEALAASEAAEAAIRAQQAQLAQQQAEAAAQQQAQAQAQALAQQQAAAQAQAEAQAQAQREAAEAQQALLAQQQAAAQQAAAEQAAAQQVQAPQAPPEFPPAAPQAPAVDFGQQAPTQQFAPQQPSAAPVTSSTPSAPVPTLPVQPRSFLEQAGYAPLDGAAPDQAAAPGQAAAPDQAATQAPAPAPQVAPAAPQAFVPPQTNTVQPLSASAWDQAAQEIAPFNDLTPPAPNQWTAPPATPAAPAQTGWDSPAPAAAPVATPAASQDGLDALFSAPAAPAAGTDVGVPAADTTAGTWGLAPTGQDEPASRRRNTEAAPQSAGSTTVWVWLIAISPILAAGAIGYILATTGYVLWTFEAAVAAPYLLVVLFALADRAGLQTLGHSEPRSPGWALLTAPVYLIMRAAETRREDGTGTMFTLVWFVSFLVAIAGFVGYGFLTGHPLVTGLPS